MLADLLSIIYPVTCLQCYETLISAEKFICTSCKQDLPKTDDHLNPENSLFQKFAYDRNVKSASAFLHFTQGGLVQKLLHGLKYEGQHEIGEVLGEWYGEDLADQFEPDVIVPIPIHAAKRRKRGYNQSLFFAKGISRAFPGAQLREDLVFRERKTSSQTRKSKVERWQNLDNVYSEIDEDLSGLSILVVDDVVTTGATVGMLCDKLTQANAESIHIACIARG